jgi:hypothetical protein
MITFELDNLFLFFFKEASGLRPLIGKPDYKKQE